MSLERKPEGGGKDGFVITYTEDKMYQVMTHEEAKKKGDPQLIPLTQKNIGRMLTKQLPTSKYVAVAFQYRYEKVGKNIKPWKPYVVMKKTLKLNNGKPRRVA